MTTSSAAPSVFDADLPTLDYDLTTTPAHGCMRSFTRDLATN